MASDDNVKIIQSGHAHILYDAALIANPDVQLFQQNTRLPSPDGEKTEVATAIGRAPVVFFSYRNKAMVLKHYYRGGLVAKLVADRYLGRRLEHSRAFQEWCLLHTMKNRGLPVPTPVAARVIQQSFYYQADLITLELEHTTTLADCLIHHPLSKPVWMRLGECIKQFHQHNIYHADLNARNILLADDLLTDRSLTGHSLTDKSITGSEKADAAGRQPIYLIDFDRGAIRPRGGRWQEANLKRLLRSLNKFKQQQQNFNFTAEDWTALLAGYASALKKPE